MWDKSKKLMIVNRVVYLIGAGATQAEIDHKGGERVNLLMADHSILGNGLSSRVVSKATKYANLPGISTTEPNLDVEKLISLLDETGLTSHQEAASQLRKLYFQEIIDVLSYKGVLDEPELSLLLLQMHNDKLLKDSVEMLLGIINLNHDPLYQIAFEQVCSGVNLGFEFQSATFTNRRGVPPLLKPHGSFNWKRGLPIRTIMLAPDDTPSEDVLWIPPTILKESKEYPFNKIAAQALELLTNCDVLRIVGCRLSQNDW
ncbi:MAG: hypothetical protein GY771_07670, partial [bacterium]|nr:hypothetical protein [bacterium]